MSEIIRPSKNDLSKNPYGIVTIDEKKESERWASMSLLWKEKARGVFWE